MDEYYFSKDLDGTRRLCLAPITNRQMACADEQITDPTGYFLFEESVVGGLERVRIIARVVSEAAAFELRQMFGMA